MKQNKILSNMFVFTMVFVLMVCSVYAAGELLPANPTAPVLGEAGRFVILASQKVTTTGTTAISNGDIGIIDQARTYMTGFTDGTPEGVFTELTNGMSYAPDDENPAPFAYPLKYSTNVIGDPWLTTGAMITQVRTDLGIAYSYLAADPNPNAPTQVLPIELGGLTLTRGVYKTAENVIIEQGDLTLDAQGDSNSVWIFTIDGTLTTGTVVPYGNVILQNGAQAKNVYWRVAGVTAIGENTDFNGNVLAFEQVNVLAGARITGRLFSVNEQVTLIADAVTAPEATGTNTAAPNVTNDDTLNTVTGMLPGMEYKDNKLGSLDNTSYTTYTDETNFSLIDFSGDHILLVRFANPASENAILTFTTNPVDSPVVVEQPASGGSGGGSSGCATDWVCSDWSSCSNDGEQTRTCEKELKYCYAGDEPALIESCTNPVVEIPVVESPVVPITPPSQIDTNVVAPTDQNLITGQAVSQSGYKPSWWVIVLILAVIGGLITGGYYLFRDK